ncbi:MAG: methylated-DNA--[protein]-cysteine S-methyltransferase [Planctomycetota bacterium]
MIVYYSFFDTSIGTFYCASTKRGLCALSLSPKSENDFIDHLKKYTRSECERDNSLARGLIKLVNRYLSGTPPFWSFPLDISFGTKFQQKVWLAVQKVGYGKTATYSKIAEMIGTPRSARAVGQALKKNPIVIIIPCHRILGKDDSLTGFACGLDMKKKLLDIESSANKRACIK